MRYLAADPVSSALVESNSKSKYNVSESMHETIPESPNSGQVASESLQAMAGTRNAATIQNKY